LRNRNHAILDLVGPCTKILRKAKDSLGDKFLVTQESLGDRLQQRTWYSNGVRISPGDKILYKIQAYGTSIT
jgi:hypothetical protein